MLWHFNDLSLFSRGSSNFQYCYITVGEVIYLETQKNVVTLHVCFRLFSFTVCICLITYRKIINQKNISRFLLDLMSSRKVYCQQLFNPNVFTSPLVLLSHVPYTDFILIESTSRICRQILIDAMILVSVTYHYCCQYDYRGQYHSLDS